MSTPTDASHDELAALRERAYGRDADILDDPAALARLNELEELAAAASAAVIAASAVRTPLSTNGGPRRAPDEADEGADQTPVASAADAGTDAASLAEPAAQGRAEQGSPTPEFASAGDVPAQVHEGGMDAAEPGSDAGEGVELEALPDEEAPARPWWRRTPVLWAASVVAAMLLGAGLTALLQSLEAGKVGVLQVDADAAWPEEVWGGPTEDSRAFETFYGLSVLSQPQVTGDGTQEPVPCLIVFSGVSDNPSYLGGACGAGPYPAQAAMVVGRQAPAELRDRFPEGTALQFVLEGEQVHVYAREPGIVGPTP
ncbi:hypothetical protein ACFC1I_07800 [Microbacterium sp. NPDC056044]|uniref:hypothetical protein n=1 Tax=Microbacterium sp. NPDC056044 TaxID=3345690 RepID=UPI0035DAA0D8